MSNQQTAGVNSTSDSNGKGKGFSILEDPCCLNVEIPFFDHVGDIPHQQDVTAKASSDFDDKVVDPEAASGPTLHLDDDDAGYQNQEVSFEVTDEEGTVEGIDGNPVIVANMNSRDTVIQHSIAAIDIIEDDAETSENDSKTAQADDAQDKGLTWWRRIKQRNLILLTLVNVLVFIIVVSLIGKHAKKRDLDSASSAAGNNTDSGGLEESSSNSTDANASSLPADHPCNEEGATRKNGVVLATNEILRVGEFICSPSQDFMVGISSSLRGDLALYDTASNQVVWSANVTGGSQLIMQQDGNIVLQDDEGAALFNTQFEPLRSDSWQDAVLAQFVVNDDGVLKIEQQVSQAENSATVILWLEGSPTIQAGPKEDLSFPVRGTFYYATYNGESSWGESSFEPTLGFYSSSDPTVVQRHVESLEYGKFDLAISSWLGQDGADGSFGPRMRMLLDETATQAASLKWTFYYDSQTIGEPTVDTIQGDLDYLKKWFIWDPAWAYMEGKPVLFVNNGSGCEVAESWMQAAGNDWFIVMRIFDGFETCEVQPDSWHEQRAASDTNGIDDLEGYYYSLSPGEWQSGSDEADIDRLTGSEWCFNVREMQDSGEPWQLVVSFNDATSGTSVESSLDWESESGFGIYLDCLNNNRLM
jgi:Glycosyl hydrolase family 99